MKILFRQAQFTIGIVILSFLYYNHTFIPERLNSGSDSLKTASPACDSALWERVYDPGRLKLVQSCIEATGIVWGTPTAEGDADYHILIRLDSGQAHLLNQKNYEYKDSCLVAEPVCAVMDPRHPGKVKTTLLYRMLYYDLPEVCDGYTNNVYIPKNGEHVKVTGPLIIDEGEYAVVPHGWREIHPVTKIELIK